MTVHHLPRGRIHVGDWREADLEPGYSLAIVDGPYGMGIADWDRIKLDDLAGWYEPHVARLTGLMAASASVYLWNTAAGWARIDPVMRAAGWAFRALVTWDKGLGFLAGRIDTASCRTWPDVTEVYGFYQREPSEVDLWNEWGEAHPGRRYLDDARVRAGLTLRQVDEALGVDGMARHWFTWSQWCLPSAERYEALTRLLGLTRSLADLRAEHARLWEDYRNTWERVRAPFTLPPGVTNVWNAPLVGGAERLRAPDGTALHACQKPLAFAERMVRASTRPGERVVVPFGGTCREAVVIEHMARFDPDEARSYDVCEKNEDGRDYVGPALAQIRGEAIRRPGDGQLGLFGAIP